MSEVPLYGRRPETKNEPPSPKPETGKQARASAGAGDERRPAVSCVSRRGGRSTRTPKLGIPRPETQQPETRNLEPEGGVVTRKPFGCCRGIEPFSPNPEILHPHPDLQDPMQCTPYLHLHPRTLVMPQSEGHLAHNKLPPPRTLQ